MIQKIKNSLKKRKVKVFLVFLFCSAAAWFISNLSESYISNTTFDLSYMNESDDLMLVNSSKDKLNVKLEAIGFQFLGFSFKKKNIDLDLSGVKKDGRQYYLPYQNFKTQIEKQLPSSMQLVDVERDTIFFDFQQVITKEVPVKPQIRLNLAQNYLLDGKLEIVPATVVIRGPRNEVDTIAAVKSSRINVTDLTSDFSRKATIHISDALRYTTFSTTSVTVAGKVSRFSEKVIVVPIKVLNLPNGTAIKMFPNEVSILCKGTLNSLKSLKASDFEVIADFGEVENSSLNTLLLRISKKPQSLSGVILQETEVEYILKRE